MNRDRQIVAQDFAEKTSVGILRIREHPLSRPSFQFDEFIRELHDIFPPLG